MVNSVVAFGCDHAGYEYKDKLIAALKSSHYTVLDCGTNGSESVDYPVFADAVCKKVSEGAAKFGILVCGTGIGMSMAANKHRGIRAAVCWSNETAQLSRRHNNANVLCIGARTLDLFQARSVIFSFLGSEFEGGRHKNRVDMIDMLDTER